MCKIGLLAVFVLRLLVVGEVGSGSTGITPRDTECQLGAIVP
jgi:hypothetical protein